MVAVKAVTRFPKKLMRGRWRDSRDYSGRKNDKNEWAKISPVSPCDFVAAAAAAQGQTGALSSFPIA
jgi:hypothetical protein